MSESSDRPNVLFIMCDQLRADCIGAMGNPSIYTPNMDRLVHRGVAFHNGYSTTPVCVAARYTIRTGCDAPTTRAFTNRIWPAVDGQPDAMAPRCGGPYLAATMRDLGYRTFGIGKFHSNPHYEDLGYDVHIHCEELPGKGMVKPDGFWNYIREKHPEYDHIEQLHGERTEMYFMPQLNPMPPELNVESFVADRAVEQLAPTADDGTKPYFGFISFIGPHPPLAPPVPFNRLYHPDRMPAAVKGDLAVDHMDEQIPYMNRIIWADDPDDLRIATCKARYYGEVTYIDWCLGRILDAVEARPDADNTIIVFYSDHGEGLGDHHAWQKESFFEQSACVPFMVSWPAKLPADTRTDELACLTDLFAIATHAAGDTQVREGHDQLGALLGQCAPRENVIGWYDKPGTPWFKIMVRQGPWKYIYFANGGQEQLFNIDEDPSELLQLAGSMPHITRQLREVATAACDRDGAREALKDGKLRKFPIGARTRDRIYQMAGNRDVRGFPDHPGEVVDTLRPRFSTEFDLAKHQEALAEAHSKL